MTERFIRGIGTKAVPDHKSKHGSICAIVPIIFAEIEASMIAENCCEVYLRNHRDIEDVMLILIHTVALILSRRC